MSAFMIAWGAFWLLLWSGLLVLAVIPPRKPEDRQLVGALFLGIVISAAWIVASVIGRALS